jgi:diguanylate cyclase (GGDEF)-like protein
MLDIGWISAYLLFCLAGVLQAVNVRQPAHPAAPYLTVERLNGLATYLPYIWLLAAFAMLVAGHSMPMAMDFRWMALAVGGILVIILFRQMMTLRENSALFRQLRGAMDQLQRQAALLGTTNHELQREISERQNAEKLLAFTALHDPLTGLPNRANLVGRLNKVLGAGRQHSSACKLLYLDLDKFKEINDSLGHSAGDQVLIGVAGRLQACLRANDIVARFGGDEFVILLEDSRSMSDAILCANRVLDKIRQPFEILDRKVFISTSIGILPELHPYTDPEDVIRDADIAMYRAKSLGKARFEIFDPDMRSSVIQRMELENELRHALERDELRLLYQPIYSLKAERLVGFEALLRWRNPMRGLVKPLDFIQLAEEIGLIIPIGRWVLAQACAQMRQWQQDFPQEPPLAIGVNISSKQMAFPGFPDQVRSVLEETGLQGESLRFEITEGLCIEGDSVVEQSFTDLKGLGIRFAIDDFGTGYSSLSYLHTYPISAIKIDSSFIEKIGKESSEGFIRSVINLARDLGLDTVAEGVETEAQLARLREYGCTTIQGNLYSPPLEESAVYRLLSQPKSSVSPEQFPPALASPPRLAPAS